jgi:hypothetical protein
MPRPAKRPPKYPFLELAESSDPDFCVVVPLGGELPKVIKNRLRSSLCHMKEYHRELADLYIDLFDYPDENPDRVLVYKQMRVDAPNRILSEGVVVAHQEQMYHNLGGVIAAWFARTGVPLISLCDLVGADAADDYLENRKPVTHSDLLKIMHCVGVETVEELMAGDL